MLVDIVVPEVGESITEGTLVKWLQSEGAQVGEDEALYELETDKITMEVVAQQDGRLHILVPEGELVSIGQVVGQLDTSAEAAKTTAEETVVSASSSSTKESDSVPIQEKEPPPLSPPAGMPQLRDKLEQDPNLETLSPAVRRMLQEHRLQAGDIQGSGKDGRLTKQDVQAYLDQRESSSEIVQQASASATKPAEVAPAKPSPMASPKAVVSESHPSGQPRQTRKKMSRLRSRIAERLVEAQHTAAILTTFNELDMTNVMAMRSRFKDYFEKQHGVRLGFMSFFVKAVVDALQTVPSLNAQIDGEEIVQNHFYDVGVAVGTEKGLIVPVLRDCDRLSFAGIESGIAELAKKAKDRTLSIEDLTGGVFTISNGGVYGSLLSTPILNPPQSGILGLHGIKKRPVVVDDQIVIRPMMYVALSYDHRIVDGKDAVTFLKRVVECMENPERMMLEV